MVEDDDDMLIAYYDMFVEEMGALEYSKCRLAGIEEDIRRHRYNAEHFRKELISASIKGGFDLPPDVCKHTPVSILKGQRRWVGVKTKTQWVLETVISGGEDGMTVGDVLDMADLVGMKLRNGYGYVILNNLVKRGRIRKKGRYYFPIEEDFKP